MKQFVEALWRPKPWEELLSAWVMDSGRDAEPSRSCAVVATALCFLCCAQPALSGAVSAREGGSVKHSWADVVRTNEDT